MFKSSRPDQFILDKKGLAGFSPRVFFVCFYRWGKNGVIKKQNVAKFGKLPVSKMRECAWFIALWVVIVFFDWFKTVKRENNRILTG